MQQRQERVEALLAGKATVDDEVLNYLITRALGIQKGLLDLQSKTQELQDQAQRAQQNLLRFQGAFAAVIESIDQRDLELEAAKEQRARPADLPTRELAQA